MQHTTVALGEPEDGSNESPFDQVKHLDEHGNEYWTGRDLQPLMQYAQWRDFALVINKAKESLTVVEGSMSAERNFAEMRKVTGSRGPTSGDFRLTRFAAYLTAMAGDHTKTAVAEARIYFAVKAREAEVQAELTEIEVARRYLAAVEAKAALQERVAVLEPKAAIADQFLQSEDTIYLTDLAKNLKITRQRLITVLRNEGVLFLDQLTYRAGYEDWFEVVMDWVDSLGQYKPALKVTRLGIRKIYELLVDCKYIDPDRRKPPSRPGDNRP